MTQSYRSSHSSPEYGERYKRTYTQGYYYEQWIKLEKPLLIDILNRIAGEGAETCLDFACGTGRILSVAEKIFPVTHGVDVSDSMLKIAREACQSSFIEKRDITINPYGKQFDIVTAFRFFLNAEPFLRTEVLLAIHKHLNPKGILVANCHVNRQSPLGMFYRLRGKLFNGKEANTLSRSEFEENLEENGFHVTSVYYYSYLPRTGWYLQWIPRLMMLPFEKFMEKTQLAPDWMAQSFILVCRKR